MSGKKTGGFHLGEHQRKGKIVLILAAALLALSGCQKSGEQSLDEKIGGLVSGGNVEEEGGARHVIVEDQDIKKLYEGE